MTGQIERGGSNVAIGIGYGDLLPFGVVFVAGNEVQAALIDGARQYPVGSVIGVIDGMTCRVHTMFEETGLVVIICGGNFILWKGRRQGIGRLFQVAVFIVFKCRGVIVVISNLGGLAKTVMFGHHFDAFRRFHADRS